MTKELRVGQRVRIVGEPAHTLDNGDGLYVADALEPIDDKETARQRVHWSEIAMLNESLGSIVHESPEAMRRYLTEMRDYGYIERDGYALVAELDDGFVRVEAEGFDQSNIDWTGFAET